MPVIVPRMVAMVVPVIVAMTMALSAFIRMGVGMVMSRPVGPVRPVCRVGRVGRVGRVRAAFGLKRFERLTDDQMLLAQHVGQHMVRLQLQVVGL